MIHAESWHKEAESLEKEMQRLLEEGHRGIIKPDEFMTRMLRLHGYEGKTETLLRSDGKFLIITHAWLQAHKEQVEALEAVLSSLETLLRRHQYIDTQQDADFHDYIFEEWEIDLASEEIFDLLRQVGETYQEGARAMNLGAGDLWYSGPAASSEEELLQGLARVTRYLSTFYDNASHGSWEEV